MRISVIMPTLGRDSLDRAVRTTLDELGPNDELIVIADETNGDVDAAITICSYRFDHRFRFSTCPSDGTGPGYAQRTYGQILANGTHLAYMDDDDHYLPGAIDVMRRAAAAKPHNPHIFRMEHKPLGRTLWAGPILSYGNVSTQMFLVPNNPKRLGEWAPHDRARNLGGDFTFISGCVERMGKPIWEANVVAVIEQSASLTPA